MERSILETGALGNTAGVKRLGASKILFVQTNTTSASIPLGTRAGTTHRVAHTSGVGLNENHAAILSASRNRRNEAHRLKFQYDRCGMGTKTLGLPAK